MTFLHLLERDVKKIFYDILTQNNRDLGKGPNENDKLGEMSFRLMSRNQVLSQRNKHNTISSNIIPTFVCGRT